AVALDSDPSLQIASTCQSDFRQGEAVKPRRSFAGRVHGVGRTSSAIALACAAAAALATATRAAAPTPATQSDAAFAASYAAFGVTNVSATTGRVSCYAPEVGYLDALT